MRCSVVAWATLCKLAHFKGSYYEKHSAVPFLPSSPPSMELMLFCKASFCSNLKQCSTGLQGSFCLGGRIAWKKLGKQGHSTAFSLTKTVENREELRSWRKHYYWNGSAVMDLQLLYFPIHSNALSIQAENTAALLSGSANESAWWRSCRPTAGSFSLSKALAELLASPSEIWGGWYCSQKMLMVFFPNGKCSQTMFILQGSYSLLLLHFQSREHTSTHFHFAFYKADFRLCQDPFLLLPFTINKFVFPFSQLRLC